MLEKLREVSSRRHHTITRYQLVRAGHVTKAATAGKEGVKWW